jgi:hypothetical protein
LLPHASERPLRVREVSSRLGELLALTRWRQMAAGTIRIFETYWAGKPVMFNSPATIRTAIGGEFVTV